MPRGTSSREQEDTDTSRNERIESIRHIRAVPVEYRSTSREHIRAFNLRDLLEAQDEASRRLMVKLRGMMTSSVMTSRCSSQERLLDPYERRIISCGAQSVSPSENE